jgi:hypothetical protein
VAPFRLLAKTAELPHHHIFWDRAHDFITPDGRQVLLERMIEERKWLVALNDPLNGTMTLLALRHHRRTGRCGDGEYGQGRRAIR